MLPDHLAVARRGERRMEVMRSSGKTQQHAPRRLHVRRLGQPLAVEFEHLVGADDQVCRRAGR